MNLSILKIFLFLVFMDFMWFKLTLSKYQVIFDKINNGPTKFKIYYGLIAWFFLALGLNYVIDKSNNKKESLINGGLFGLIVYGVYNATNMTTVNDWTLNIWLMDNLWGIIVCAFASFIGYQIKNK